jgi:iron complex outermembrane receptor protein
VAGVTFDRMGEARRGFQNFIGARLGVDGALRRDESNLATSRDAYLQASWRVLPAVAIDAGLRRSDIRFRTADRYIAAGNPDDSGSTGYRAWLPVLGVSIRLAGDLRFYANAGRGFETPTLNELSYRPDGRSGFNFALVPASSDNAEVGLKARWGRRVTLSAALFDVRTRDEIVTATNTGGRSSFQNAGGTRRRGAELLHEQTLSNDWRTLLAWTWIDARYRDDFLSCAGTPCAAPNLRIPAGNRLPGVAGNSMQAEVAWQPAAGWRAALELQYQGAITVDDRNSDRAPAATVANLRAGYLRRTAAWTIEAFARIDNLADRRYAGSVIVNEGNGRFFEPARGRTVLAGASASFRF